MYSHLGCFPCCQFQLWLQAQHPSNRLPSRSVRNVATDVLHHFNVILCSLCHADKNQHRLEEADKQFKDISNAYEVLSDKHERAWYDSHREQILRSGDHHQAGGTGGFTPGQKPDDEIDLFQYFTSGCFQGFGDGPKVGALATAVTSVIANVLAYVHKWRVTENKITYVFAILQHSTASVVFSPMMICLIKSATHHCTPILALTAGLLWCVC